MGKEREYLDQPIPFEISVAVDALCPVCVGQPRATGDIPGWGMWLRCQNCSLEFVHPLELRDNPTSLYEAAYLGEESRCGMDDYAKRLRRRDAILSGDSLWFWTPAYDEIIRWLNQSFRKQSTVLELGCALGFFLHALKREGFRGVGLDVAETPVVLNRQDGFEVWHGALDSMPNQWVQPDVVISLFVLHHLSDPMAFLREIGERWPDAPLVLALHGPSSVHAQEAAPPRSLTQWSRQSISEALTQAGYVVTVKEIPSTGQDNLFVGRLIKLFTWLISVPLIYRSIKRVANLLLSSNLKPLQREANVLLVFAEPRKD